MAITQKSYERIPAREWKGVRVEAIGSIGNRHMAYPAGYKFTITGKGGGFALLADACEHCGVQGRIAKVGPYDLRVLVDQGV